MRNMYQYLDRLPQEGDIMDYVNGVRKIVKTKPGSTAKIGDTIISINDFGDIFTVADIGDNGDIIYISNTGDKLYDCPSSFLVLCKTSQLDIHNPSSIEEWDARFKAGLPISYCSPEGDHSLLTNYKPSTLTKYVPRIKFYIPTQKEQTMSNLDLKLLTKMMAAIIATEKETTLNATNAKHLGILTKDSEYIGYVYFNELSEATAIMQLPENEGKKLHIFDYQSTIAQKPRKIVSVDRV